MIKMIIVQEKSTRKTERKEKERKRKGKRSVSKVGCKSHVYLQKVQIHPRVRSSDRKQRNPMVERDWLYRFVGIEIEMIVILVAFFGHVGLLDRSRMNAQRAMQRASCRVFAPSMLMLHVHTTVPTTLSTLANILYYI